MQDMRIETFLLKNKDKQAFWQPALRPNGSKKVKLSQNGWQQECRGQTAEAKKKPEVGRVSVWLSANGQEADDRIEALCARFRLVAVVYRRQLLQQAHLFVLPPQPRAVKRTQSKNPKKNASQWLN